MGAPQAITLIGGGGHAVVIAEAARLAGMHVAGCLDDDARPAAAREPGAIPRLGSLAALEAVKTAWICALGDVGARRRMLDRLAAMQLPAATVVHPRAWVSPGATLGPGVFVGPLAVVHSRAEVGAHAIVNSGAVVEHDCRVGENCHVAPNATLGGAVCVGPASLVGLGAAVLPGVSVGSGCVVGAGAVVRRGVEDCAVVAGSPARPVR